MLRADNSVIIEYFVNRGEHFGKTLSFFPQILLENDEKGQLKPNLKIIFEKYW